MKNKGLLIRAFVSIALLVLLFYMVKFQDLFPYFKRTHLGYAFLVVLSVVVDRAFMAYKWRILVKSMGIDVPLLECVRVYLIGNFMITA